MLIFLLCMTETLLVEYVVALRLLASFTLVGPTLNSSHPHFWAFKYQAPTIPSLPFPQPSSHPPIYRFSGEIMPSFPATFPSSDVGAQFPDFDTGFTLWDDVSSFFEPVPTLPKPDPNDPPFYSSTSPVDFSSTRYHACFDSPPSDPNPDCPSPNSDSPKTGFSGLGSESDQPLAIFRSDPPGSDHRQNGDEPVSIIEERKRKRKQSNRESARRSRLRKQKHLENIAAETNQLEIENRELTNRLRLVNYYSEITRTDNERLLGDCVILRRRLTLITQILHSHQLHTYSMQTQ